MTFKHAIWPVHTERLCLRPFTPADIEHAWSYRQLVEVTTWTGSWLASVDEWREFASPRSDILAIEHEGELVGDMKFSVRDGWGQRGTDPAAVRGVEAELGWTIDPAHAGQGYATEAARALMHVAFDTVQVRRVVAYAFADNAPSVRIMEKLGMRREFMTKEDSFHMTRGWIDGVGYAMLGREWRDLQKQG
ncbi:GNAT family N-acetyltransferase [Microbacterium karelineae]|uniref:GNAT family N-acetyltransferase n=1 Tax=Microbacterium karelineae TaxID=2654283 RepID=UPI001E39897F|nr:GNAT family N-acetyltransferase [Microbacterium karelineae]